MSAKKTKKYVIGVDFGTLSGRALLVEVDTGKEVASAVLEYSNAVIDREIPGTKTKLEPDSALQDPEDYLQVLKTTIPEVLKKAKVTAENVIGLATDFTASSPMPCYSDGTPLCFDPKWRNNPHSWVKLWKHHAAQPEADHINEVGRARGEKFIEAYGGKYSSEWFYAKLLQVLHDAPDVYDAAERWIEAADWIVWQLTGVETRCVSVAGYKAMWVYPYGEGWAYPSPDFFAALHPRMKNVIEEKLLTRVHPLGSMAGKLSASAAALTGLKEGTPVATSNIDAHVAVPACTVTTPGKLVMIMGTSTCNLLLANEYRPVQGMCGAVLDGVIPGYWGYEAGQSAVGDIYAWYTHQAVPGKWTKKAKEKDVSIYQLLDQEAGKLRPGESGLLALDWWNGNRSVLVDANLSGCIFGLTLLTTPPEIYRSLIEATAFGQRKIIEAFETQGIKVEELYACGGLASKSDFLMQTYADILNRPIRVAESAQTCALGSAMHAAVACGYYPNIEAATKKMAKVRKKGFAPKEKNIDTYNKIYAEYSRLHDLLGKHQVPTMKTLKNLR